MFIGITEKWDVLEETYDNIKGTFAEIPSREEYIIEKTKTNAGTRTLP